MSLTNEEVVRRFASRQANKSTGTVDWKSSSGNVFSKGDTLYSYGSHFVLAKYLGEERGKHLFLKNGDRYSLSTGEHQRLVQSACYGPTVSFSGLSMAGMFCRTRDAIVDWQPDLNEFVYRDSLTGRYYTRWDFVNDLPDLKSRWTPPRQGVFWPYIGDRGRSRAGCWHILGAVLFRQNDDQFLCGIDEGRYFVSQLSRPVRTVKAAFESLKPSGVKRAEKAGVKVTRQGEWFFVPTGKSVSEFAKTNGLSTAEFEASTRVAALPRGQDGSNLHVVRHASLGERVVAFGRVFHRDPVTNRQTREHQTVRLGGEVHEVYKNTELASWSMGGRFD